MLNQIKTKTQTTLTKKDILDYFYNFPTKTEMKIGMELERLPINNKKLAVKYGGEGGVKNILEDSLLLLL